MVLTRRSGIKKTPNSTHPRHATPLFKDSAKSKTTTASAIMPLGAISISYSSASYTMREISSMREFAFASSRLVSTTMT